MYKINYWAFNTLPGKYGPYVRSETGAEVHGKSIRIDSELVLKFEDLDYFGYQFRTIYFQPSKSNKTLPRHIYLSGKDSELYKLALELKAAGLKSHSEITEPGRNIFLRKITLLIFGLILFCALLIFLVLNISN